MTPRLGDRSLFPELAARVYLNHAAMSPPSLPVRSAAEAAVADYARRGIGVAGDQARAREVLRGDVAAWLGVEPAGIGFPPGTTRGILDIALALDWRAGDRVIVFDGEFPSNVGPWQSVAERFGAHVEKLPLTGFADGSGTGLARVEDALREGRVRLVAVSAVQFASGLRMPLEALGTLARAHGAELFVDAVQALGIVPIEPAHVDYLVAGTHKWLMGLDGLAVAWASAAARHRLRPLTAGWLSVERPLDFLLEGAGHLDYDKPVRQSLDWMEGGVQTFAAFAALHASVRILRELGVARILDHVQALHGRLEPALQERGFTSGRASDPSARSGTLSLRVPTGRDPKRVAGGLMERGISVSTPDGWLRLSPHWPNGPEQVATVIDALDEVLAAS